MLTLFALVGICLAACADVNYDSTGRVLTLTDGEYTLATVSKALNMPEVFTYDAEKHIACCRASLAIGPGATLSLNHEVLRMDCPKGEFAITDLPDLVWTLGRSLDQRTQTALQEEHFRALDEPGLAFRLPSLLRLFQVSVHIVGQV